MNFWDQQFSAAGYKYGEQPNAFLVSQAASLPPGARILVPGDGEGRNGVWLAQQGHRVLALDLSAVGLDKARALATRRGVTIRTQLADLAEWQPEAGAFDAVVLSFVHLPPALRTPVHRRLADALRPGGVLILEAFQPGQLGRASGGPRQIELLYALSDLRSDFAGLLNEELGQACEVILDEGPGHQGAALVTRFRGRRI